MPINNQEEHRRTTVLPSNVLLGKTALGSEVEQERESIVNLLRTSFSFNAKNWLTRHFSAHSSVDYFVLALHKGFVCYKPTNFNFTCIAHASLRAK